MTEAEMIKLARQTLSKLGYPKEFIYTKGKQKLAKPTGQFEKLIPRCQVEWMHPDPANMSQWSYVEIDAEKKRVTAVYLD